MRQNKVAGSSWTLASELWHLFLSSERMATRKPKLEGSCFEARIGDLFRMLVDT